MDTVASGVGVVDRSVAILAALAESGPLGLADLAAATGLARPTAHRLARAWEAHGVIGRDEAGRFRIGSRLGVWAGAASSVRRLVDTAQPVLDALRDETGESVQLFVREGDQRVCVAIAERPSGLRDTVPLGAVLPLDRGSGGTVLLAFAPDAPLAFDAVRADGWAESAAEREAGVASVSAPVRAGDGVVVASIGVSGPIERLGHHPGTQWADAVVAAASTLSRHLAR